MKKMQFYVESKIYGNDLFSIFIATLNAHNIIDVFIICLMSEEFTEQ